MHKPKFIAALGFFNAAVFLMVTLFLPNAGSFSYSDPVSYYVNSRTDWHIAFGVLISTILISCGLYLLIGSFQKKPQEDES